MATAASAQGTAPRRAPLRGVLYALVAFVAAFALHLHHPFLINLRYLKRAVVYRPSTSARLPRRLGALVDVGLITLFGLQHSLMARGGFKRWLARNFPGWSGQTSMPPT
jgi:hypothetical protein